MNELNLLSPGQRLKELRRMMKLRQEEIAGDKFSKNYISMFENNKRSINAINATYLANKINEHAKSKGYDIYIQPSYLLKSELDLAKDKCEKWLLEVETNLEISDARYMMNLYKTIYIASKYGLTSHRAKALYLKGVYALNNERYQCAMTQLLGALVYYARENDFSYVSDIYEKIGIILYNNKEPQQALVYFNLSYEISRSNKVYNRQKLEELNYFIALCYYETGQYLMALKMLGLIETDRYEISELANRINKVLAG